MKPLYLGLIATATSFNVVAAPSDWTPGFGGDISLMAAYTNTNSQFSDDNETTSNLNSHGEDQSSTMVAPLGTISYTLDNSKQQLFFGTDRSDVALGRFHAELGYRQKMDNGSTFSISYIPGLLNIKTWQDPFLTNEAREKTDSHIKAIRVKLDNIAGSMFSIDSAYGKYDIDNEKSGASLKVNTQLLDRNSDVFFIEGSHLLPLSQTQMLRTALNYSKIDASGKAMSSDIFGGSASFIQLFERSSLALTLSYKKALFDAENPIFSKTQEDDQFGAFLAYEYKQPFGWKDWGVVSLIGYNTNQSNIDFYDADTMLVSLGMNYRF
ncbi:hypothetical periplasmic protein [Photobacterium sp. SKA34]|uniref:DUF2860 domain-containing protein n=1 Tax=Photobacterium sp. SKA34 TaxID=121723 RepID=UPI00006BDBFF|nr:DUF2860 domain-containing protein [Photobacterium sp. SKA34]EAR56129.1 hypothetical periplasmic protein [Photobacterium sp. SKA34]